LKIPAADAVGIFSRQQSGFALMETKDREEILRVCRKWVAAVKPLGRPEDRMNYFDRELPSLLAEKSLFADILKGVVKGSDFPDLRQATLFENELVLYQDPARIFSLRLYVFGGREYTFVHDHSSWGVSGSAFGRLEVVRYRRKDHGSDPGQARLAESERFVLRPGETETTLPFDRGIHRTGNPSDGLTLMVSVYGPPLRRLYIQRFNLESGSVQRVFPPRLRKKMLAEQALKAIEA
jgi:predicted metal-dependent enzyme (double-stranded beta helix superfamily)